LKSSRRRERELRAELSAVQGILCSASPKPLALRAIPHCPRGKEPEFAMDGISERFHRYRAFLRRGQSSPSAFQIPEDRLMAFLDLTGQIIW
jgi:hypothetical protein